MNTLVLETTLGGLNIALRDAQGRLWGRSSTATRSSSLLHGLLAELLAEAGLQPAAIGLLAVSIGPGSFTGARVAVAVAEAWGLAQPHCQCLGLHTLMLVAKAVIERPSPLLEPLAEGFRVLTDAAGGMVYSQDFNTLGQATRTADCVPLAEGLATSLPIVAAALPLVEVAVHLDGLTPTALLAAVDDPSCHAPVAAVYLKPLAYRERQPA